MNYILAILFVLLIGVGYMGPVHAEGTVYDPLAMPQAVLTCTMPVTREDGSPLAVGDIARVDFEVSGDGQTWQPAGSGTQCRLSLDFSGMSDGQYFYTATAVDTWDRRSQRADPLPFVLQRIQPPNPPTNLGIVAP